MFKEERSNLISEIEELHAKMYTDQTMFRKNSLMQSKQFEAQMEHMKEETEKLKLDYVETKNYVESMKVTFPQ